VTAVHGGEDAGSILAAIRAHLGTDMMALFALGLMKAGLIAAIVIAASSASAVGEAFGIDRPCMRRRGRRSGSTCPRSPAPRGSQGSGLPSARPQ